MNERAIGGAIPCIVRNKRVAGAVLAALLSFILSMFLMPARQALAKTSADGLWEYDEHTSGGTTTITITAYLGNESRLDIPETIDDHDVTAIGEQAFYLNETLVSVSLPKKLSSIEKAAFMSCFKLETVVVVGDGLKIIPEDCFRVCPSLKYVSIADSVESIGPNAFSQCDSLQSVHFETPSSLKTIGEYAFFQCSSLSKIEIASNVETIGEGAFSNCKAMSSVTFGYGSKLKTVGAQAFAYCEGLDEVWLPGKLENLGPFAFYGCRNLRAASFLSIPTTVGEKPFDTCDSLQFLAIPNKSGYTTFVKALGTADVPYFVYELDEDKDEATIVKVGVSGSRTDVILPKTICGYPIVAIGKNACDGSLITSITFPEGCQITSIGDYAFHKCRNLTKITIPSSVTSLGKGVFQESQALNVVTFQTNKLTSIPESAFEDCKSIVSITIPDGVKSIGKRAFYNCLALEEIYLPDSLTLIGDDAFYFETAGALKKLRMPDSDNQMSLPAGESFMFDWDYQHLQFIVTYGSWFETKWLVPHVADGHPPKTSIVYKAVDIGKVAFEDKGTYTYTGKKQMPQLEGTRWWGGLINGTTHTITPKEGSDCTSATKQTVVIKGIEPYFTGETEISYVIDPVSVEFAQMDQRTVGECFWDNIAWKPTPTFAEQMGNDVVILKPGVDYELSYPNSESEINNYDAGYGAIFINGIGNFTGKQTFSFEIRKRDLATEATVEAIPDQYYTGSEVKPVPEVSVLDRNGSDVWLDEDINHDFTTSYLNNVQVGTATITITAQEKANVTGTIEATFNIVPSDLGKATIEGLEPSYEYTGSNIEPTFDVKRGDITFVKGRDYDVTYENNRNVGTATLTVTGKNNCTGTLTATFEITPKSATVTANDLKKDYSSEDPQMSASVDGVVSGDSLAYAFSREPGEDVGEYAITVSGEEHQGNYDVTYVNGKLTINVTTIYHADVDPIDSVTFDGTYHEPKPNVSFKGKPLAEEKDYTLFYTQNLHAGDATVYVLGKGNFAGEHVEHFTINPRDISGSTTEVGVGFQKWTGSAIEPKPSFVRVAKDDGSYLKLKEGTDYKIVGYENNVDIGTASLIIEGVGDYTGRYTAYFIITDEGHISNGFISPIADQPYTGSPIEPRLRVFINGIDLILTEGVDYIASFDNNTELGTANVTVVGAGLFADTGTLTAMFEIVPADISEAGVTAPAQTYSGEALEPEPTVTIGDKILEPGVDYEVTSYAKNVAASSGSATISIKGLGNYTGETSGTFDINPAPLTVSTGSAEKPYDGTALVADEATIEGLMAGETASIIAVGSQTEIGSSENAYELTWETADSQNYEVIEQLGMLTVHKSDAEITLTASSASKTYDATPLTSADVTYSGLPSGFTIEAHASGSQIDAGEGVNRVASDYVIKNSAGEDRTSSFTNVKLVDGTLTVQKRSLTLVSATDEKEYDGTALTNNKVTVSGDGWAGSDGATYDVTGSQTMPGSSENEFTYELSEGTSADNYDISTVFGTLTVTSRGAKYAITVRAQSAAFVYDGSEHEVTGFDTLTFEVDGNTYEVTGLSTTSPSAVDAGTYANNIVGTPVVKDVEGNDVTSEFSVSVRNGSLTIGKRVVTLTSETAEKEYDGSSLVATEIAVGGDGWAEGDAVTYDVTGSQTLPGTSENRFTYALSTGVKAGNYEISTTFGTLTVKSRGAKYDITVVARSAEATYDGKDHWASDFETLTFEVEGRTYVVAGLSTTDPTEADVGTYANNVYGTPFVTDADGHDVTSEFAVSVKNGSLVINKRQVSLTSADSEKVYDGFALTNGEVSVGGDGWAEGEEATYDVTGSQTVPGAAQNEFTYALAPGAKAGNYDVSTAFGTLTVTSRSEGERFPLLVESSSVSVTYDAEEHRVSEFEALSFDVASGNKTFPVSVEGLEASGKGIDAGSYRVEIAGTPLVRDAKGNDVTSQFVVSTSEGTLSIGKRAVTLTSATDEKEYDGSALTNDEISVGGDGWAEGEGARYDVTGSRTVPGTSENTFTYQLSDGTKEKNYDVSTTFGTLTVTSRGAKYSITVVASSDNVTYDGKEHGVSGFETLSFVVEGNTYEVDGLSTTDPTAVDAGTYVNNITGTAVVTDGAGNDVSSEFAVSVENGSLTIGKRKVELVSADAEKTYDGKALTNASVSVQGEGFVPGEGVIFQMTGSQVNGGSSPNSFTYAEKDGTNLDNYEIAVTFGTLSVRPASFKTIGRFSVDPIEDMMVTGKPVEPRPTAKDAVTGKELVEGVDYTLSYENNINVGVATVHLVGQGNYDGQLSATFNIVKPAHGYILLNGGGQQVTQGSRTSLEFRFDRVGDTERAFAHFTGASVDGRKLTSRAFAVREGSVVLTLQADYVATLDVGTHTLTAHFDDGSADATFVVKQSVPPIPQTDDETVPMWVVGCIAGAGALVALAGVYLRRK